MSRLPAGSLQIAGLALDLGWDLPDAGPDSALLDPLADRLVEVAFSIADYRVVALAFGVPLALVDPARLAAEHRLTQLEPDRWADDGGALP